MTWAIQKLWIIHHSVIISIVLDKYMYAQSVLFTMDVNLLQLMPPFVYMCSFKVLVSQAKAP